MEPPRTTRTRRLEEKRLVEDDHYRELGEKQEVATGKGKREESKRLDEGQARASVHGRTVSAQKEGSAEFIHHRLRKRQCPYLSVLLSSSLLIGSFNPHQLIIYRHVHRYAARMSWSSVCGHSTAESGASKIAVSRV
ncbi:hypothetical protein CPB85DRAFT_1456594 [Mucidula mucida]|nr:hypothetical protein CPB85DRAFT_1456594 [Mucidula mucida]